MIAEIHHKISSNGSNLTDRLEDNLTGDFFGAMRYIPFNQGLKPILASCIYPQDLASVIEGINAEYWNENISFWPYDNEGEIDVIIEFPEIIIGIEVKYLSGLSSNDDISNELITSDDIDQLKKESCQQLARESRIISHKGVDKLKILIFIADESTSISVYNDTISRNIIANGVFLATISWQDILLSLKQNAFGNKFEQLIQSDLVNLLTGKGFEHFNSFSLEKDISVEKSLYYYYDSLPFSFDINEYELKKELYYEFR